MSEVPRTIDPRAPESVAAEKSLLDEIQTANMAAMSDPVAGQDVSILEKAREKNGYSRWKRG